MLKYHKIQTIYKRGKDHKLIYGDFSLPEFKYLYDNKWVFTEKIDGTNIRVYWNGAHQVHFFGRSDNAQIPHFLLNKLQLMFYSDTFIDAGFTPKQDIYLFGEGYGNKIQKIGNKYIPNDVSFILFDVFVPNENHDGGIWMERENVEDVADKLGIKTVPILGEGSLKVAEEMTKFGFKSTFGDFTAEGLVCRPEVELLNRRGFRVITKIKYKDFKELQ